MSVKEYFIKMAGGAKGPPAVGLSEVIWSCLGSAIGIGICGYLSSKYFEPRDLTLIIGSFGASAVLVYGAVRSPLPNREILSADMSYLRLSVLRHINYSVK